MVLAGCLLLGGGAARAGAGTAALELVPADSTAIVAVDLDRLRSSPYHAAFFRWLEQSGGLADHAPALTAAGIDLRKDLSRIVVAGDLSGGGDRAVILIQGRFRPQRVAAQARKQGVERKHAGVSYFEGTDASAALVGTILVLAPDAARVRAVIDLSRGKGRAALGDRRLGPLVRGLDRSRDAWMVVAPATSDREELARVFKLEGVVAVAASVDLRRGMTLAVRMSAADAAVARRLADMLGQGKRLLARDKRVGKLARKLAVSREGRSVDLSLDLTDAELRQLLRGAGASGF